MKRTINSTGRKKLPLDHIALRLEEPATPGGARSFSAGFSDLSDLQLPADAKVYVEPYAKSSFMRFDYGTVEQIVAPSDTALTDIDAGAPVLFDIKIVDESDVVGRILAAARHISPLDPSEGEDNRKSLLPVVSRDLGELVWQLEMLPGTRPILVLNSRIPSALVRLKSDPLIQGSILPAAVAKILDQVLDPEGDGTDDDEWVSDWKTWYRAATGSDAEEVEDADLRRELVLKACQSFATQQRFATRADPLDDQPEVPIHD